MNIHIKTLLSFQTGTEITQKYIDQCIMDRSALGSSINDLKSFNVQVDRIYTYFILEANNSLSMKTITSVDCDNPMLQRIQNYHWVGWSDVYPIFIDNINTPIPKQVIVVRKDLNMPVGKLAAQVAHASMGALLPIYNLGNQDPQHINHQEQAIKQWLSQSFTKVVLQVSSLEQLNHIISLADELSLPSSLITDNGLTCFNGVHIQTCGAIGPAWPHNIDYITKHLKLYR